jgi:hypothetical protein
MAWRVICFLWCGPSDFYTSVNGKGVIENVIFFLNTSIKLIESISFITRALITYHAASILLAPAAVE